MQLGAVLGAVQRAPCWAKCWAHQEGVEAENELAVAKEEVEHAVDDARRVDALRLELLHDVEELPQDARARAREIS